MSTLEQTTLTGLLKAWSDGDPEAPGKVLPLVYDELRAIAHRYARRERRGHTLEATAILHEAYLRLAGESGVQWQSRGHFVGLVAHVMRRVLVDYARERNTARRGGRSPRVTLVEAAASTRQRPVDLLDLDRALAELAELDPQKVAIVEMRYFGGLTIEETAQALAVSEATVVRQWRKARAWLLHRLDPDPAGD